MASSIPSASILTRDSGSSFDTYRCICGKADPPIQSAASLYVQCAGCDIWQHTVCMGLAFRDIPEDHYFCESCVKAAWVQSGSDSRSSSPMSIAHLATLEAIENGKKIWEERLHQFLALRSVDRENDVGEEGTDVENVRSRSPSRMKSNVQERGVSLSGSGPVPEQIEAEMKPQEAAIDAGDTAVVPVRRSQRKSKLTSKASERKWYGSS